MEREQDLRNQALSYAMQATLAYGAPAMEARDLIAYADKIYAYIREGKKD